MSRYDYYSYFKPSQPIETDQGIKAKSKRGEFVKNWWANRWIKSLEKLVDAGRLRRGRTYARKGQVLSIEETKAGLKAKVQGSRRTPYKVTIEIDHLSDAQWERVIDALAEQAIFSAQLLAGEMPDDIEDAFRAAGVSLFPETEVELITECSCPDWANPCKHVAAVHYILGEQFDEDPFMLFRLRGRTQDQILAALRTRRADTVEPDEALVEETAEPVLPLAEMIDTFWEVGQPLTHFKTTIKPPVTEFPVLKRLGQPSFLADDLLTTLGPTYHAITEAALTAAFGEETENGEEQPEA
ncbi:MAG: SWIM zinc finger family protein [Anaerolineae bacterium]|nr:SWIM zinc finger family protein [Anaerolineae bacterium]